MDCISTHSLTKRLTRTESRIARFLIFQLTASRRGWLPPACQEPLNPHFNSQPHEEADNCSSISASMEVLFQLTASRRGWLSLAVSKVWFIHFNSQPHEEADENSSWENLLNNISTHSLTKRLTANCYRDKSDWEISTHSLTKRLTNVSDTSCQQESISTHSLTKRLTMLIWLVRLYQIFQLTASRRGWHILYYGILQ